MSCKRSFPAPVYYWILFSTNIKWKAFEDNNISYGNSKTSLVRSNYFWWLSSIPKIIEPFEKLLGLISVIISDTKLKPDISDELVSFDEVIILELRCLVDLMTAAYLFCKLKIDAFIFPG